MKKNVPALIAAFVLIIVFAFASAEEWEEFDFSDEEGYEDFDEFEDFDEVVKLDLKYIDNWSLLEDFKILLQTVGVVLFGRGAK